MSGAGRVAGAARREQLIDVAADIVASGGTRALTIEAVVAKAGVHRPTVYRHFANAEALLDAVVERRLEALQSATAAALVDAAGFEPRLRAVVSAWMELFAADVVLMSTALVRPPSTEQLRARQRRQNRGAVRFMAAEIRATGVDAIDAEVAAAALLHALVGVVEMWRAKRIDRRTAIDRFVRIAVGAVGALGGDV